MLERQDEDLTTKGSSIATLESLGTSEFRRIIQLCQYYLSNCLSYLAGVILYATD